MIRRLRQLVRDRLADRLDVPSYRASLDRLQRGGFAPQLVVDVGAYRGEFTADCRKRWPDARVVAIEPASASFARLQERYAGDAKVVVHRAIADAEGGASKVLHFAETASSVLDEHVQQGFPSESCVTVRVDELVAREPGAPTSIDLLKVDVQGYSLPVLRGAERALGPNTVIASEVDLLDIHRGASLLDEVLAWAGFRDFVVFDIAGLSRRPLDKALWQVDLILVHRDSQWRRDKRWEA